MPTKTQAQREAEQEEMRRDREVRERAWRQGSGRCKCSDPILMTYLRQAWCKRCAGWAD